MKDNKSGWQFPKALEIIKCKEGNKEFMKERPARRPFGNTVLICEYPIDDTAAEEPNAKLITWRLAKRAARDFLRVSFMPSAIVSAATHSWVLSLFARKGMKILDTHAGSGSSLIACYRQGGLDFVGFEIDEDYYRAANERLEQEQAQIRLFDLLEQEERKAQATLFTK